MSEQKDIAMAMPADPQKRAELRRIVKAPMAVYANSIQLPCTKCQMLLLVGPRVAERLRADTATLYCPWCAALAAVVHQVVTGEKTVVNSLGNKAARHEFWENH